jgi:hypothetical protein
MLQLLFMSACKDYVISCEVRSSSIRPRQMRDATAVTLHEYQQGHAISCEMQSSSFRHCRVRNAAITLQECVLRLSRAQRYTVSSMQVGANISPDVLPSNMGFSKHSMRQSLDMSAACGDCTEDVDKGLKLLRLSAQIS